MTNRKGFLDTFLAKLVKDQTVIRITRGKFRTVGLVRNADRWGIEYDAFNSDEVLGTGYVPCGVAQIDILPEFLGESGLRLRYYLELTLVDPQIVEHSFWNEQREAHFKKCFSLNELAQLALRAKDEEVRTSAEFSIPSDTVEGQEALIQLLRSPAIHGGYIFECFWDLEPKERSDQLMRRIVDDTSMSMETRAFAACALPSEELVRVFEGLPGLIQDQILDSFRKEFTRCIQNKSEFADYPVCLQLLCKKGKIPEAPTESPDILKTAIKNLEYFFAEDRANWNGVMPAILRGETTEWAQLPGALGAVAQFYAEKIGDAPLMKK